MADLTPLFAQCVRIVSEELKHEIRVSSPKQPVPYLVSDSFSTECAELYKNMSKLTAFVAEVRPLYLQVTDEFTRYDSGPRKELSRAEKQALDEEFKLKVQQIYEKLKYLQEYERKREQVWQSRQSKKGFLSGMFATDNDDPDASYHKTLSVHRMHMLRFLSDSISGVNASFEQMQKQRYARERSLNLLHIQNLDENDDWEAPMDDIKQSSSYQLEILDDDETKGDESKEPTLTSTLSQEQIQELSRENQQLLDMKNSQFKQVEKLHHSMVDIVKLQTELTMHLETQAEQIDTLLENQDMIDVDLRMGNKNLSKATDRNKRGSNLIVTTCLVLGALLLFVDYIS